MIQHTGSRPSIRLSMPALIRARWLVKLSSMYGVSCSSRWAMPTRSRPRRMSKANGSHARSFSTSDVLRMMKAFNNAATDMRGGWQPSLSLELALAEVLDAPNSPPPPSVAPLHSNHPQVLLLLRRLRRISMGRVSPGGIRKPAESKARATRRRTGCRK